jgi:hypothetical protein
VEVVVYGLPTSRRSVLDPVGPGPQLVGKRHGYLIATIRSVDALAAYLDVTDLRPEESGLTAPVLSQTASGTDGKPLAAGESRDAMGAGDGQHIAQAESGDSGAEGAVVTVGLVSGHPGCGHPGRHRGAPSSPTPPSKPCPTSSTPAKTATTTPQHPPIAL